MSRHNGLPGYDAWKTRSDLDDADRFSPGDDIECDNCGDLTRAWDYAPDYSRFCIECLAGLKDADPRADRGCWQTHQERDQ